MSKNVPRKLFLVAALATSAIAVGPAQAGGPLCNEAQRPATGNIGQHGRVALATPRVNTIGAVVAPVTRAARGLLVRALLRPAAVLGMVQVERPLLTSDRRPACSNHVGKGARPCESETATVTASNP